MRLIDADELLKRIDICGTNKFGMLDEDIREFVKKVPTIDAVVIGKLHTNFKISEEVFYEMEECITRRKGKNETN